MKIKSSLAIFAAATLLWSVKASAQTDTNASDTNDVAKAELKVLFTKTVTDIKDGKKTEADLSDDLKQFDVLLAKHQGEKTDSVANILFMKAMLYNQVIGDTDKGKAILEQLKTDYPGTKPAANADKVLTQLDEQVAAQKKLEAMFGTGNAFPDFDVKDLNGKPLSVANYKGKVVLVDFWATWCGPCRGELPNVIATYKKNHDQGFEIIGVSLDQDRDKLDAFLKQEDGMTWPQFFDGQGWKNALAVKYGIESIPFDVLIGPDGKILGKDLRGEDLGTAVTAALAKK